QQRVLAEHTRETLAAHGKGVCELYHVLEGTPADSGRGASVGRGDEIGGRRRRHGERDRSVGEGALGGGGGEVARAVGAAFVVVGALGAGVAARVGAGWLVDVEAARERGGGERQRGDGEKAAHQNDPPMAKPPTFLPATGATCHACSLAGLARLASTMNMVTVATAETAATE